MTNSAFAMRQKLLILTPIYRDFFSPDEEINIRVSLALNADTPHAFFLPEGLDDTFIRVKFPASSIVTFPKSDFKTRQCYSALLLNKRFYERFIAYSHILILQPDAVLIRKIRNDDFIDFDYLGAPWKNSWRVSVHNGIIYGSSRKLFWKRFVRVDVGNGGLSFRRINAILELLSKADKGLYRSEVFDGSVNEDFVLSCLLKFGRYRVPDKGVAGRIFIEAHVTGLREFPEVLGFHAIKKHHPRLHEMLQSKHEEMT
jgi:Protein of unknown function (DUF5672)